MMNTGKVHLIDPNFQKQHCGKCDLLLYLSPQRICYAIIDRIQDQLKALVEIPIKGYEALEEVFKANSLLSSHFHQVKIAVESFNFTFIPAEVYSEDQLPSYRQFVNSDLSLLVSTDIKQPLVKNITAVDERLVSFFREKLPDHKLFSSANPFIEGAMKAYPEAEKKLFINFNPGTLEILLTEGHKLLFYNIFPVNSEEDLSYFLLLVLQELELNPLLLSPIVAGDIDKQDHRHRRLQKYFTYVQFADSSLLINTAIAGRELVPQRYFALLSLSLCE